MAKTAIDLGALDRATECINKARGILFCMSQMMGAELISSELEDFALWAVRDLLDDAGESLSGPKQAASDAH